MSTQPAHHQKVDENSPDRCQGVNTVGQCNNCVVPGSKFCIIHGGSKQQRANEDEGLKNYRLGKFRARVNEFADNPQAKNLREEVGIVRMQLEFLIEKCADETDLLLYSERISRLVTQIQVLVLSCQKLEEKSGSLLDKTQLFVLCETIVKIIGEHVTDSDVLDMIANKIMATFVKSVAVNPVT